ncbi:unnamed protein product [Protopolystoma xenopodis]|uniref:Uncharacterized protein n=1 Tax=Protopolystoma xenopodis TaxID=117903 RepID=A0A3S5A4L2_9PLAT|nr:unnamed protein product [Protopolystoma xenopodis]
MSESGQINSQPIVLPECNLHEDIGSLLFKQLLTDVTLVVVSRGTGANSHSLPTETCAVPNSSQPRESSNDREPSDSIISPATTRNCTHHHHNHLHHFALHQPCPHAHNHITDSSSNEERPLHTYSKPLMVEDEAIHEVCDENQGVSSEVDYREAANSTRSDDSRGKSDESKMQTGQKTISRDINRKIFSSLEKNNINENGGANADPLLKMSALRCSIRSTSQKSPLKPEEFALFSDSTSSKSPNSSRGRIRGGRNLVASANSKHAAFGNKSHCSSCICSSGTSSGTNMATCSSVLCDACQQYQIRSNSTNRGGCFAAQRSNLNEKVIDPTNRSSEFHTYIFNGSLPAEHISRFDSEGKQIPVSSEYFPEIELNESIEPAKPSRSDQPGSRFASAICSDEVNSTPSHVVSRTLGLDYSVATVNATSSSSTSSTTTSAPSASSCSSVELLSFRKGFTGRMQPSGAKKSESTGAISLEAEPSAIACEDASSVPGVGLSQNLCSSSAVPVSASPAGLNSGSAFSASQPVLETPGESASNSESSEVQLQLVSNPSCAHIPHSLTPTSTTTTAVAGTGSSSLNALQVAVSSRIPSSESEEVVVEPAVSTVTAAAPLSQCSAGCCCSTALAACPLCQTYALANQTSAHELRGHSATMGATTALTTITTTTVTSAYNNNSNSAVGKFFLL